MFKSASKFALSALFVVNCTVNLQGTTLKEVVEHTMANNPKIISTIKNNDAYRLYIDEAKGGYLPSLDLTAYLGTKSTRTNPDVGANTKESANGSNIQLDFEQLIYDGGLTTGQIEEAKFRYNSNKFLNDSIVDDIIYDSVDSYLNLVKYKNKLGVTAESLKIYEDYLLRAKDTEEITGEGLHKAQVNAKIHLAKSGLYEDTNNHLSAISSFKKNVGIEPDGMSCRPVLDENIVPDTITELIDQVLVKNPLILEQVENIKEQRAILNQKDADFYPTLKFKAQGIYDNDLETENEKTRIYSARIELAYNIFNGGSSKAATTREKLFLEEAQKTLDSVTNDVVDETVTAYNTYIYSKKREQELQKYIQDNREILSFYKDQFEGGTRTFIDVLNIERDLISAKDNLVDVYYDIDSSYFQIFNNLGQLKQSVVNSNNITCPDKYDFSVRVTPMKNMIKKTLDETTIENKVYALYIGSYGSENSISRSIEAAKTIIGEDYKIKSEKANNGFDSVVIYDIPTIEESLTLKTQLANKYPDAYIRKFNK